MKNIVAILSILSTLFIVNKLEAQVLKKQADKIQLINGVKLESKESTKHLIKVESKLIEKAINNQKKTIKGTTKKKPKKPPKILKFNNKRRLKTRKNDE